jgi:hypothetical protein
LVEIIVVTMTIGTNERGFNPMPAGVKMLTSDLVQAPSVPADDDEDALELSSPTSSLRDA